MGFLTIYNAIMYPNHRLYHRNVDHLQCNLYILKSIYFKYASRLPFCFLFLTPFFSFEYIFNFSFSFSFLLNDYTHINFDAFHSSLSTCNYTFTIQIQETHWFLPKYIVITKHPNNL